MQIGQKMIKNLENYVVVVDYSEVFFLIFYLISNFFL